MKKVSIFAGLVAIFCFASALWALFTQPSQFTRTNDALFAAFSVFGFLFTIVFMAFDRVNDKERVKSPRTAGKKLDDESIKAVANDEFATNLLEFTKKFK